MSSEDKAKRWELWVAEAARRAPGLPFDDRVRDYFLRGLIRQEALHAYLDAASSPRRSRTRRSGYESSKRVLDFVLALGLALFVLPLATLVCAGAALLRREALFYSQWRVGRDLRPFRIYKFRTLVGRASSETRAPLEKSKAVVDAWGAFLRAHKIDELPQLVNVIGGDMSLVGPRPLPLHESLGTPAEYWSRFEATPGMTGLWQVEVSSFAPASVKWELDARYARTRSWRLDLVLLWRTVRVVLKGEPSH